ncbi:DUF3048 domain-containing protein [Virgibacillus oceani]
MRKFVYLLVAVAALIFAGCSNDDEDETQSNEGKDSNLENKADKEAEEQFDNMYPLTGIGTNEAIDNRTIGVMVNNHTQARPQSGLSDADIVFEILAEARITRLLALYQSEIPDVVGPVRSAREYYFTLANNYGALYVYHGAADFVNDMIVNRGIDYLDGAVYDNDGTLFKRESFREAPHNSYALLDTAYERAEGKGYETTLAQETLPFLDDETADIAGGDANHVEIVYSDNPMNIVEYEYDPEIERYVRYSDREKTIELDSSEEIQLDNVFVLETYHETVDAQGRRAVDLEAGGNAYLMQKGKVQEVEWENRGGRIVPVKEGEVIGFVPGKTWVNVVPASPGLDQMVTVTN